MSRLFAGTPFDRPPTCDRCGQLESECHCEPIAEPPPDPSKQSVKVRLDRRKNKRLVTVVWGLAPDATQLRSLLSKLQSTCGSGGSVQDGTIELQGDHVDRVRNELKHLGYKIR
jgi:translation initiation factor 1